MARAGFVLVRAFFSRLSRLFAGGFDCQGLVLAGE